MAKRKKAATHAAPRHYTGKKKKHRRKNTLNAQVHKKLGTLGGAIGAGTTLVPLAIAAVGSRSIAPLRAAASAAFAIETGKRALIGYIAGTGAGLVVDKFAKPLKRPINKALKIVGMR
jgi:hypothetical protein